MPLRLHQPELLGWSVVGFLDESQYLSEGQKECLWITSILTPFRRAPPDLRYPITQGMTCPTSTNGLITQEHKQIK